MSRPEIHDRPSDAPKRDGQASYEPPAVEELAAPDGPAVTPAGISSITGVPTSAPRDV